MAVGSSTSASRPSTSTRTSSARATSASPNTSGSSTAGKAGTKKSSAPSAQSAGTSRAAQATKTAQLTQAAQTAQAERTAQAEQTQRVDRQTVEATRQRVAQAGADVAARVPPVPVQAPAAADGPATTGYRDGTLQISNGSNVTAATGKNGNVSWSGTDGDGRKISGDITKAQLGDAGGLKVEVNNDTRYDGSKVDGPQKVSVDGDNNRVTTGAGADTVQADGDNNAIKTGAGRDEIEAYGDKVKVDAGAGNDYVRATADKSADIKGGSGHDTIVVDGDGTSRVDAGSGHDYVKDDTKGASTIAGGSGKDILIAKGEGKNTVAGGKGKDTFSVQGQDRISDRAKNENNLKTTDSGKIQFDGTDKADNISVSNRNDGRSVQVDVNGRKTTIDGGVADRMGIHINGKGGDDRISGANTDYALSVDGGDGNDRITGSQADDDLRGGKGNDIINAGGGNDTVYGGAGNDVINGGRGNDQIHGLDGDDILRGGKGNDEIVGGRGDDRIDGGDGNDALIGGRGDDVIHGGKGDDALAGYKGKDTLDGGDGSDKIYRQAEDKVVADRADKVTDVKLGPDASEPGARALQLSGTPSEQAILQSHIDALRALPSGRKLLSALDDSGKKVHLAVGNENVESTLDPDRGDEDKMLKNNSQKGTPLDAQILIDGKLHSEDGKSAPSSGILFHELVHAYNTVTGTMPSGETNGIENAENVAVGTPIDHDGDPNTPDVVHNPFSENSWRSELNQRLRADYNDI